MLKESVNNQLEYQRLSQEEMEKRGILGRLVGICADFFSPTRNGRKYPEELWEKVFESPIMKERIENGVCYGELGHPADREETDMEKIAVCLAEPPKKGSDGKLRAVFDILSTPNGKILKSLCDYGSTLGVSSRGSGDLETDFDGNESVNPDTYNCEGFDIVLIPAVKEARLEYVTESLNKKRYNKTLRDRLTESINKEGENNQKIMRESLNTLGIKLDEPLGESLYKDVEIEEKDGKFYCLNKSFNSLKNAKIYIDMQEKNEELNEEQVGRDEVKPDKDIGDVLNPEVQEKTKEHSSEEDKEKEEGKVTVTITEGIDWTDLNSTEQFAAESAISYIKENPHIANDLNEIELVVSDAVSMYNEANAFDEYADEDFYEEEADSRKVLKYVLQKLHGIDESLSTNIDLVEDVDDINAARMQLCQILDDWYNDNIANERVEDVKLSGWDSQLQDAYLEFRNELAVDAYNSYNPKNEAVDNGAEVNKIYESFKKNNELEQRIAELQEKLSVCYAKEISLNEELDSYKEKVNKLSDVNRKNSILNEKLSTVRESKNKLTEQSQKLNESLKVKNSRIEKLTEQLNEAVSDNKAKNRDIEELTENYETARKDLTQLKEQYSKKIEQQNNIIEKYQKITRNAVNKYIDVQATRLGVRANEITNRLPESYSFNDIDRVCEDLKGYKLNIGNLPFNTSLNEGMGLQVKNIRGNGNMPKNDIDEISDYDLKFAEAFM